MGRGSSKDLEGASPQDRDRRAEFESAASIEDQTERLLEAAAIIHEEMEEIGYRPVIVGGLAVAYWAAGVETTSDIDVLLAVPDADLSERLLGLGLERIGRVWATPDRRVSFDRPGLALEEPWRSIDAESPSGRRLRVLSLEDTIISRMHDLDGGGHLESFNQALTLLRVPGLDRSRLTNRASEERLPHVLARLDWAAAEVEKGRVFEAHEVHGFFPILGRRPTI